MVFAHAYVFTRTDFCAALRKYLQNKIDRYFVEKLIKLRLLVCKFLLLNTLLIPSINAKRVWSLPMPTFLPGRIFVPR